MKEIVICSCVDCPFAKFEYNDVFCEAIGNHDEWKKIDKISMVMAKRHIDKKCPLPEFGDYNRDC